MTNFDLRAATLEDIPTLETLIATSGIGLSVGFYTTAQAAALAEHVFGVDSQLIRDGTYYVVEENDHPVACGGWSRRRTLYGADRAKAGPDPLLDPATEAARIRAFFVHPAAARRGLARMMLAHCTEAARAAGFGALELASTLPGEPLYLSCGFSALERFEIALPGPVSVPLTRMRKTLAGA